jgi:hypothetical protein
MAFRKDTSILFYDPRPSVRYSQRQYFLYPVRMYRVIAPRVSSRKLNILEKAVLGICNTGVVEADIIGEHLNIGKDLVGLIITQLSDRGLINSRGLPTAHGLKILEDETLISQDAVAGFVFQDPWTGELLPRFAERESYAEVRFNDAGFPELVLGTTGKPDYRRPFMPINITDTIRIQPSPSDILNAIRQHHRALRNSSQSNDYDEDTWMLQQVPYLERISFIDEEPIDLWLTTCLYTPENVFSANIWNVCDPFGVSDSPWLRRRFEKHEREQTIKGLQKLLLNMVGKQRHEADIGFADWVESANREASLQVEQKLTVEIRRWQDLLERLVTVEQAYLEAKELENSKSIYAKLDNILVEAQKAAECVFHLLQKNYPTKDCWKHLSRKDREFNRNFLNQVAEKIGFMTPLPHPLLSVDCNYIKLAADSGKQSLRPHVLAALLTAINYPEHPLRSLAQKYPSFLQELDELAKLRNQSGHASNQQLNLSDIEQQIDTVYKLVATTLQLSYQP